MLVADAGHAPSIAPLNLELGGRGGQRLAQLNFARGGSVFRLSYLFWKSGGETHLGSNGAVAGGCDV